VSALRLLSWDTDDCRRVHEATLAVLEQTGVEVKHERARELLAAAGARVDGTRVRVGGELVARALASVPRRSRIRGRGGDGELDLDLTVENSYFGTGSDCLYVCDPDSGERRRVRLVDVEGMAALCERLPNIDFVMSMGLPEDVRHEVDDVAPFVAMLKATRKPLLVATRDARPLARMKEMAAVAGASDSFGVYSMPTPPLMHDFEGMDKLIRCAELDIPLVYAPAPSIGATAPASITAAIVTGNAEVLSGTVVHQFVKPGAPLVYGCGVGKMNMRTLVDTYNPPEIFAGHQAEADLARWYGLPSFAYAGHSDSKMLDEQWASEASFTIMLGALSGATLLHDVGYLETGLQSSFETILIADELIGYARAFTKRPATDEEALALEEIMAVGPGGDHLGRTFTRQRYRGFWQADLCDQRTYDRWLEDGGRTMKERAKERVAELRSQPRSFALDDARVACLDELLAEVAAAR
jgi:trimethylamine--corrinoid protein Co-methyltransferase